MKRWLLVLILLASTTNAFPQRVHRVIDSLYIFFKEFHISTDIGYYILIPNTSTHDDKYGWINPNTMYTYDYLHHNQWDIAVAAENEIVRWRLAIERDYLNYGIYQPKRNLQADYLRASLSLQIFLLRKMKYHILLGPAFEWDRITRYVYSTDEQTLKNPNIGQTLGHNFLLCLTFTYAINNKSRVFLQTSGGLRLRHDHDFPSFNHWGYGLGPEAALMSNCPLSVGIGYNYLFK
ncbi:MAG: hypothetical protein J6X79_04575 [Bacteroidales bacterium]|nr:hypothetical protein [Bacteroidales bacterium]